MKPMPTGSAYPGLSLPSDDNAILHGPATVPAKTFVLGVGAQKCGTTWLHSYLGDAPDADLGITKEYHIWDAIAIPSCERFRIGGSSIVSRLLHPFDRITPLRRRLQRQPSRYFDYFAKLLGREGIRITADITPVYCALPVEVLAGIRDGFARHGIFVRPIFLMRDPVDRVWSHFRMLKLREKQEGRPSGFYAGSPSDLPDFARSEDCWLRTDYPSTIANLRTVFPEEELFFGFFETMFQEDEIQRLSRFVGMTPKPMLATKRVFEGAPSDIPSDLWDETYKVLSPIYERCEELFPATKSLWGNGARRLTA